MHLLNLRSSALMVPLLVALLFAVALLLATTDASPHRHSHHKQKRVPVQDDYEYRDFNDYSSGVAVDYAKVSTTKKMAEAAAGTTQSEFQKTNRYPKMRKFYDSDDKRRWYEALFAQKRK